MPHDQDIRAGHQVGNRTHGFHQNPPLFRIAQYRRFFDGLFGFFTLPHLVAQVVDNG